MCQANANNTTQEGNTANTGDAADNDILQRLVSEAVKKVLQHPEILAGSVSSVSESSVPQALVSQVVQELKPTALQTSAGAPVSDAPASRLHRAYLPPAGIPSYKPTPISELKKRHIPVPYTPSPAPRGSSKVQVKRSGPLDDSSAHKRLKSDAKNIQKVEEEYNPEPEKDVTYNPSSLKYSPPHNGWSGSTKLPSYIPSSIDMLPKCNNDYVPSPVSSSLPLQQYCPTEKSGSRSEPNYVPECPTNNISEMLYTPTVKAEVEDDIVNIDLSTEFDLLDEILNENSNESQKGNSLKNEDSPVMHSVVNSDEPKLNVKNDKPKVDVTVKLESEELSNRKHKKPLGEHAHVDSHSEPEVCSSSNKKEGEKLKRINRSRNKRHSSEKTKEQDYKRHDRVKHSNSSRSEHRKSVDKCSKTERGERTEKKDTGGDSKGDKHHKLKEKSRTKERHAHHSEKRSERRPSSKTLVKVKSHSGSSRARSESQGHHHHHHYRHKHTLGKHHQESKAHNREHKTAMVTATGKMRKKHRGEASGMNAGKLFQLYQYAGVVVYSSIV
jgi:hypothetical protein